MKLLSLLLMSLLPVAAVAQSEPSNMRTTKTTEVMVMLTVKPGVTRDQVMKVMPTEVRATVKLYLDGKIRQWYSRGDGRGVVFFLDVKTVEEAHAVMEDAAAGEREPDGLRVH